MHIKHLDQSSSARFYPPTPRIVGIIWRHILITVGWMLLHLIGGIQVGLAMTYNEQDTPSTPNRIIWSKKSMVMLMIAANSDCLLIMCHIGQNQSRLFNLSSLDISIYKHTSLTESTCP